VDQVVSVSDSQSGGPGSESHSGHLLDSFLVVRRSIPEQACKYPTGYLLPVGIF